MPRAKSHTREDLVSKSMRQFWRHGYQSTSIDDLVRVTGVNRHGIYSDMGGKGGLFVACLDAYVQSVVTPAFARVEKPGATLDEVAQFFEYQIGLGESAGLPGIGCLMANTMTEVAPHNAAIFSLVDQHNTRLRRGFSGAIRNTARASSRTLNPKQREDLALVLVVFANGLWSMSRTVSDAVVLRKAVNETLELVRARIDR